MKENDKRTYLDEVVSKSLSEEMIFKERNKKNEKEPALLHLERRAFETGYNKHKAQISLLLYYGTDRRPVWLKQSKQRKEWNRMKL